MDNNCNHLQMSFNYVILLSSLFLFSALLNSTRDFGSEV